MPVGVALLSGCGMSAGHQAAEAAFDVCVTPAATHQVLELEGRDVRIAVTGETARAASGADAEIDAMRAGNYDGEIDGIAVAMSVVVASSCMVDETGYPGSYDQLRDGDEWDGWRYREESGAGSEFVATFTATN